jgi:hypothetical protein
MALAHHLLTANGLRKNLSQLGGSVQESLEALVPNRRRAILRYHPACPDPCPAQVFRDVDLERMKKLDDLRGIQLEVGVVFEASERNRRKEAEASARATAPPPATY